MMPLMLTMIEGYNDGDDDDNNDNVSEWLR